MKEFLNRVTLRGQVSLGIVLILNLNFFVGCGGATALLPNGAIRTPLGSNQDLAFTLAGTPFSNATAVDINPVARTFSFVFPDGSQQMSGSYTEHNGEMLITQFSVTQGDKTTRFGLNVDKEIISITTADGTSWNRPEGSSAAKPISTTVGRNLSPAAQAYVNANSDLLSVAEQLDAQAGVQKTGQGAFFWLAAAALTGIVLIPAGVVANLLFVFGTIAAVTCLLTPLC